LRRWRLDLPTRRTLPAPGSGTGRRCGPQALRRPPPWSGWFVTSRRCRKTWPRHRRLLARLDRRLVATFRRHPLSAVATVAFLGLAALDLVHLRGAVALHALRPAGEGAP
jgi:hypothetical protein